jgi:hypothetical protein
MMRLRSIFSEAMRNIACGTTHAVAMFLIASLAGGLLGGYEVMSVLQLEGTAATRINSYADVRTVVGGAVDGSVCDRLSTVANGPSTSGAMRAGDQITPTSTPGKDIASYEVTPGMLGLMIAGKGGNQRTGQADVAGNRKIDATGVWVSTDVANDIGLTRGSRFETDQGNTTVAGVFSWPNDGRDTRFAYAVITPVSPDDGTFEECWAKQWPGGDELDSMLYSTVNITGSQNTSVGVTQLNKGFDLHYDAPASYANRTTRWLPYVGGVLGILIGVISIRRRRLEYAGALHSGQCKSAQLLEIAVETAVWSGLAAISVISVLAAVCARMSVSDPTAVFLAAIRTPLAFWAGIMLASIGAGAAVRESQLFRFFKNR